jgi:hypothetical protein
MIPKKLDIIIWRGGTFELELVTQVKVYNYDPDTNTGPADLKRTHLENLEHYGFTYEYVDFATDYTNAELRIIKPWVKSGQAPTTPLMQLSKGDEITLTANSIKIVIDADTSKTIEFDSGTYELLLTRTGNIIDPFIYGDVTVLGDRG